MGHFDERRRRSSAFRMRNWYRGEKDPYLGRVEMKPQKPFKEDVASMKRRLHDEAMLERRLRDTENNAALRRFSKVSEAVSAVFAVVLVGAFLYAVIPASGLSLAGGAQLAAMVLFGVGFLLLLLHKNLMKKLIGLGVMDAGIFLFMACTYINRVPVGAGLACACVSVLIFVLMAWLIAQIRRRYHTLDLDELSALLEKEEVENP